MRAMEEKIRELLRGAIKESVFPGAVAAVSIRGDRTVVAEGNFSYDPKSQQMSPDSIFDCASITKSVPTSSLALLLIDKGELSLTDKMIRYIPEYKGAFGESILIRHLLTHTLNFDFRLSDCKTLPADEILQTILTSDLKCPPGEQFFYANATSILLGMVIERVCKAALPQIANEYFFSPLGMSNTTFDTSVLDKSRTVPTEEDAWRGRVIQGEVHDESAWALRPLMTAGSAGLFSTASDLLEFSEMLLCGGVYRGKLFLTPTVVQKMYTDQLPHIHNVRTGLGWELDQGYMGAKRSRCTFGKTGFTGTVIVLDRPREVSFVLLSNYTWPVRKRDRSEINRIRAQLADIVFGVL